MRRDARRSAHSLEWLEVGVPRGRLPRRPIGRVPDREGYGRATAHQHSGIVTLTFEDGRWLDHTRGVTDCSGPYSVEAGRIFLRLDVAQCGEPAGTFVMSARWTLEDGKLRFFDFTRGRPLEWSSKPWTKID